MNPIFIIARIFFPLLILRYPLAGGILAIILDNLDWHIKTLFGISPVGDYQLIDKGLDMFYLSLLFIVALRFKNLLIKRILIGLFVYRLIGFILFEITHLRFLLMVFPNVFENFFFFYLIVKSIAKEPKVSWPEVVVFLLTVTIPKLAHEYSIHIIQKPLVFDIFGFSYQYDGLYHQAVFILVVSIAVGVYYRRKETQLSH